MAELVRRRRATRRAAHLGLAAITAAGVVVLASPAWAHVTVHPATVPAGSSDVELTFRVPNERDNASTVTLQVFFPTNPPLLTLDVLPVPGWTAAVHTQALATPIQTDDGPVSEVVSDVTWKATDGGIEPGQYEDFPVAAGSVPDRPARLVFKALQTYSSGEVVRWIEVPTSGQPAPDFPAPVLSVTPASASTTGAARSDHPASSSNTTPDALAGIAMGFALVSLVGLAVVVARGRRARTPGSADRS